MRLTTALVALLLPHAAALAVRSKLAALRPGPNLEPPARVDPAEPPGPRDVVIKLYDISTPELCKAMSLLASKPAYWFPKLSVGVGRRTWSYDGEPEETYDAIIQNAAGGPPLRTWNCGATALSDAEIDAEIARMGATEYTPEEYDFFLRNCNHFCYDLAERMAAPLVETVETKLAQPSASWLSRGFLSALAHASGRSRPLQAAAGLGQFVAWVARTLADRIGRVSAGESAGCRSPSNPNPNPNPNQAGPLPAADASFMEDAVLHESQAMWKDAAQALRPIRPHQLSYAPPAPGQAQGGLQPRPASASLRQPRPVGRCSSWSGHTGRVDYAHRSEAILNQMPGGAFQQKMTRAVTFQVQA